MTDSLIEDWQPKSSSVVFGLGVCTDTRQCNDTRAHLPQLITANLKQLRLVAI